MQVAINQSFKRLLSIVLFVGVISAAHAQEEPIAPVVPEPTPEKVPESVEKGILPFSRIVESAISKTVDSPFKNQALGLPKSNTLHVDRKTRVYTYSPLGLINLHNNARGGEGLLGEDPQRDADANDGKDETAFEEIGAPLDAAHLAEFKVCANSRTEQGVNDINAYWMSALSTVAYLKYPLAFERLKGMGFEKILFVEGPSDVEVFVAMKLPKKNAKGEIIKDSGLSVVSFRGTDDIEDWLINLDATTEDINHHSHEAWLHEGFAYALNEVYSEVIKALDLKNNPSPLFITGHSMGGALGMQMAIRMISRESEFAEPLLSSKDDRLRGLYVFGIPRVGNVWARNILDKYMNRTKNVAINIHTNADPATKVPFDWMGYKRFGSQVHVPYSSNYDLDYGNRSTWNCYNDVDYKGPSAFSVDMLYTSKESHKMRSYVRHFSPWRARLAAQASCEDPVPVWGARFVEENPVGFHHLRPVSQMNRSACDYSALTWGGNVQL